MLHFCDHVHRINNDIQISEYVEKLQNIYIDTIKIRDEDLLILKYEEIFEVLKRIQYHLASNVQNSYCYGHPLIAIQYIDHILQLDPQNIDYNFKKAHLFERLSKYEQEMSQYDHMLRIWPKNMTVLEYKANLSFKLNSYLETIQVCDQILKISKLNVLAYQLKALSYQKLEQYEQALITCDGPIKLNIMNYDIQYLKAILFTQLGRNDEASQVLFQLIEQRFYYPYYLQAILLRHDEEQLNRLMQNYREVENVLQITLKDDPYILFYDTESSNKLIYLYNQSFIYYIQGAFCNLLKSYRNAIIQLDQSISLDNKNKHAYSAKGQLFIFKYLYLNAIQIMKKVLEIDSTFIEAKCTIDYCQIKLGYKKIIAFKQILESQPWKNQQLKIFKYFFIQLKEFKYIEIIDNLIAQI